MNMVGSYAVSKNRNVIAIRSLSQPVPISGAVFGEAEQEGTIVAAVGDVINLPGEYVSAGAGYTLTSIDSLEPEKDPKKRG